ncbi:MAG: flagellar biosynthesis protein FlhB [Thermodesulfobacteriota bacterium]
MAEDKGSKTEQPTARRLSKAREQGQVAKSVEVNTVFVLLAAIFALFFTAPSFYRQITTNLAGTLSRIGQISIEGPDLFIFLIAQIMDVASLLAPILIVITVVGVSINLFQIGPVFTMETLKPNLARLNPITGLSRLFNMRSLVELIKSVLKIIVISGTAYLVIRGELDNIVVLGDMEPAQIGYYVLSVSFHIFLKTCWAMLALSVMDLAYQKWKHHQDMMMTKEEVKEEFKQTEGDPQIKARIRSIQRDLARKRMMAKVPQADVVVTNPSHLAVALMYDAKRYEAPVMVAKGRALLAEKIKAIAREHNVPVLEDKPLAQALYKAVEIGQTIPVQFYQAVAEMLSYVYRLKGRSIHGG